jgi:hypothetical protein
MDTLQFAGGILAGGLLGILGQGIRTIIGIKKLQGANELKIADGKNAEPLTAGRIILSLFIGLIAGGIGILVKTRGDFATIDFKSTDFIIAMIAVGYSGTDFIEGIMKNYFNIPPVNKASS